MVLKLFPAMTFVAPHPLTTSAHFEWLEIFGFVPIRAFLWFVVVLIRGPAEVLNVMRVDAVLAVMAEFTSKCTGSCMGTKQFCTRWSWTRSWSTFRGWGQSRFRLCYGRTSRTPCTRTRSDCTGISRKICFCSGLGDTVAKFYYERGDSYRPTDRSRGFRIARARSLCVVYVGLSDCDRTGRFSSRAGLRSGFLTFIDAALSLEGVEIEPEKTISCTEFLQLLIVVVRAVCALATVILCAFAGQIV